MYSDPLVHTSPCFTVIQSLVTIQPPSSVAVYVVTEMWIQLNYCETWAGAYQRITTDLPSHSGLHKHNIIAMYVCEAKTHARVADVEPAIEFETLNAIEQELMMGSKGV